MNRPAWSSALRLVSLISTSLIGITMVAGAQGCGPTRSEAAWAKANGSFSKRAERCGRDQTFDEACLSKPNPTCAEKVPQDTWGRWKTPQNEGRFDPELTEKEDKASAGGSSCCYSWCAPLKVVDAMPETSSLGGGGVFCVSAPPGGVSKAAVSPYEECPAAIAPPNDVPTLGSRFSPDDTARTRRNANITPGPGVACCYTYKTASR